LFAAVFTLAVCLSVLYVRINRRRLEATVQADVEAGRRRPANMAVKHHSLRDLEAVVPAWTYGEQRGDQGKDAACPPDQTGQFVVCVICLDTLQDVDRVRRLPCHHIFHAACIDKWFLKKHLTCPLCMAPYYTEPPVMQPRPIPPAMYSLGLPVAPIVA
jgi:hypothetical protein